MRGRGGFDELQGLLGRRADGHGQDEGVLAPERRDEGGGVVVVDVDDGGAGGEGVGAGRAREGGDLVLAGSEQSLRDRSADLAAGLCGVSQG